MRGVRLCLQRFLCSRACILPMLLIAAAPFVLRAADAGGGVEGEVRDASGAVIPNASVLLVNSDTGQRWIASSNAYGWYDLAGIPVGVYRLTVSAPGFSSWRRWSLKIDVAASVRVDATMTIGQLSETVTVTSSSVNLDTSGAQTGQVLDRNMTAQLPLNGRSYTDLLALQAGVAPATTLTSDTVQGLGQNIFAPSGGLNAGVLSINGQRESSNSYIVNGANAEETGSMAAAIVPNLDSIEEFRILAGNFDAEFGRSSGGQISVVTRSGGNLYHGDLFAFVRNTDFDARNYFSSGRGRYQQNQFGGVFGGPLRKDRAFFFADLQQTRQLQGADTGLIPVPTDEERGGDFSRAAQAFTAGTTFNGSSYTVPTTVSGSYLAGLLGPQVTAGEPFYFSTGENYISGDSVATYSHDCVSANECVFPYAFIPQSMWSAPGKALLQYIPSSNVSDGIFSTSASNSALDDTKEALRIDGNSRWGRVSAYAAVDNYRLDDPYPTAQGGANVPGFNAISRGGSRLMVLEHDKPVGAHLLNQAHLSYTRVTNDMGKPAGGVGVSLASQGFVTGSNTLGIVVGQPASEGVESVAFGNFTIGVDPNRYLQVNNIYEASEDLSRIWNLHALKFGIHVDHDEINTFPSAQLNGSFQFYGSETGSDFADFLIGVASQYNQNGLRPFYERENYVGAYAEDSWRLRPSFTLNYGLRWDRIEPWWEKYNNAMTLVAGEQSQVFPTAPKGIVYPGDPGIARTLAPARSGDFAPRIGLAWSPRDFFGRIFGASVLRAGFGFYFTAVPGETLGLISDNAPYGFTYTSPAPPLFSTPFMDAATGHSEGQRFPAELAPLTVSRGNPDSDIDWSRFEPISAVPGYDPRNKTAYTEEYTLSFEYQLGRSTLVDLSYAGNQSHRLLVLRAANPGDAALCLSLSQASQVAAGSTTCGPFGEDTVYKTASGVEVDGTRSPLGPAFSSVSTQAAIGNAAYNSLQTTLRSAGRYGELLAGYTWSKSLDMASNFGDQVNPFNPALSRSLSSYDLRQNLVFSYTLHGSLARAAHLAPRLGNGWELGGITRFSTGFPVTLYNYSDTSLWGTQSNGVNNLPADEPSFTHGKLNLNHNPRNGQKYFNTALFGLPAAGEPGNARRRFFSGPGMENFDMNIKKTIEISERAGIELRAEAFNVFNHPQFFGPESVNGNITNSSEFGQVLSAMPPRLMQLAAKLTF